MKGALAFSGVLLSLVLPFQAFAASPLPAPTNYVNDYADVLTVEQEQNLNQVLEGFEKTTTTQIFVAIVQNLNGQDIESYAGDVFEAWKIGQADKDTGLLILASIDDNIRRIEIGYGLEGALTDGEAGEIIRTSLKPSFQNKAYYQGLSETISQIESQLTNDVTPANHTFSKNLSDTAAAGVFIFFILFQILSASLRWLAESKSYWQGGLVGGVFGLALALILGSLLVGGLLTISFTIFGLILDYLISKNYKPGSFQRRSNNFWLGGGGWGGGSGGGFGGGGGGSSGGGGASG